MKLTALFTLAISMLLATPSTLWEQCAFACSCITPEQPILELESITYAPALTTPISKIPFQLAVWELKGERVELHASTDDYNPYGGQRFSEFYDLAK